MISEKNRTRNLTITLRVTSSERELFLRGAEKRNMTLTDFLVSAALYKPSHAIKECKAILKKLNEVQAELLRAESDHPDYADVLAAQIKPHFIYNAISAIQYVASMRGQKDIELSFASAGKPCTS